MLQRGTFVFTRQKYKKFRIQRHKSPYTESFCKCNIELNCFSGFLVTGGRTRSALFCRFSCYGKVGVVNPFFPASLLREGGRGRLCSASFSRLTGHICPVRRQVRRVRHRQQVFSCMYSTPFFCFFVKYGYFSAAYFGKKIKHSAGVFVRIVAEPCNDKAVFVVHKKLLTLHAAL